jgi:PAS domain S-box-containing protein
MHIEHPPPADVPDAPPHWLEVHSTPLFNRRARHVGWLVLLRDRTEHRQMEAALREQSHRLTTAEAVAHLGSWELDIASGQCHFSDEFFRICGYAPGGFEPTAERAMQLIHPDDRERAMQQVARAMEEGVPYHIEKRIVQPDGTIRWVHSMGEIIWNEQRPRTLIGAFLDITERKRAEEALREREQQIRRIGDNLPNGIIYQLLQHPDDIKWTPCQAHPDEQFSFVSFLV